MEEKFATRESFQSRQVAAATAPRRNSADALLIRLLRLRQDGRAGVQKKPSTLTSKVLGSGDVLLIRSLPLTHPSGFPSIRLVPTARFSSAFGRARAVVTESKNPDD